MHFRKVTPLLAMLPMLLQSPAASAGESVELLARTGKWNMNYANGACNLFGTFGAGVGEVTFKLVRIGPDESPRISLFGKRFAKLHAVFLPATITFLPVQTAPDKTEVIVGNAKTETGIVDAVFLEKERFDNQNPPKEAISPLPPVDQAIENAVSGLRVEIKGLNPFQLNLQSMAGPMAAMRRCTDNLIASWGYDPAELKARQSRATPVGMPSKWLKTDDWNKNKLGFGNSALVAFRVNIDEAGTVTDCVVQETTSPPTIGPFTCDLIKRRARFNPSLDAAGKPAKDFYINRVFWRSGY